MTAAPLAVHASAVLIGEVGVVVRGPAGAGKTSLCLALADAARARGLFARLIGDDRLLLRPRHGRLIASVAPGIAGLVERRGLGLTPLPHEARAVVALVVDRLAAEPERMPEPAALIAEIAGVTLPRLAVGPGGGAVGLVLAAAALFLEPAWAGRPEE
jgi:serine kinase of HPr protein (carbohydrate metabolism regulator)